MIIETTYPQSLQAHVLNVRAEWETSSVFSHSTNERKLVAKDKRSSQSAVLSDECQKPVREYIIEQIKPRIEVAIMHPLGELSAIHLIKYVEGDFFSAHRDRGGPNSKAIYTVIGVVREPKRGGELIIYEPERRVIPSTQNKLIAFPALSLHEGARVQVGVKEIFVCWIYEIQ